MSGYDLRNLLGRTEKDYRSKFLPHGRSTKNRERALLSNYRRRKYVNTYKTYQGPSHHMSGGDKDKG